MEIACIIRTIRVAFEQGMRTEQQGRIVNVGNKLDEVIYGSMQHLERVLKLNLILQLRFDLRI
jgi:hypothetical protein